MVEMLTELRSREEWRRDFSNKLTPVYCIYLNLHYPV